MIEEKEERGKERAAVKSEEIQTYLEESRGLERSLLGEILRSRKRAWIIAVVAACFGFAALVVLGVQIKESSEPVSPFILRVDNATGQADVLSVMKEQEHSYGEIIDQYWVAQYVIHRESYDWETIQADYEATGLMSSPEVAAAYHRLFEGENARDKALGDRAKITVTLDSAPLIDPQTGTATARYTTTVHWRNGRKDDEQHWIATIAYQYVKSAMKPRDRLINPLGFQVTSYRQDPVLGSH